MLKVLFIGDIVAKLGRKTVKEILPSLKKELNLDIVLANIENVTHGKGASQDKVEEMLSVGIDAFTSGNHIFNIAGFEEDIEDLPIARPANWPPATPGKPTLTLDLGKKGKILLLSFLGRVFLGDEVAQNPFIEVERLLEGIDKRDYSAIIIDLHGEATSEKAAFAYNLDGRVSAVLGTHTHVATADQRVLPAGTGFVTDVGMVGALHSSLGVSFDSVIPKYFSPLPSRFEWPEKGEAVFNSVLLTINDQGLCGSIERVDKVIEL